LSPSAPPVLSSQAILARLQPARLEQMRLACVFMIGATMPISVTFSEIFSLLGILVLLAERRVAANWRLLRAEPVFWAAMTLFAVLGIGMTYSSAPPLLSFHIWWKYRELAYLPFFMLMCRDERGEQAGLYGFFVGVALILLVGTTPLYRPAAQLVGALIGRTPYDSAFGSYITEGMLVALAVYFFIVDAIRRPGHRPVMWFLIAWSVFYVLFLNAGRTGFVVLVVVAFALLLQLAPRRMWLRGSAAILVTAALFMYVSPRMHNRMVGVGMALHGQHHNNPDWAENENLWGGTDRLATMGDQPSWAADSASARLEFLHIGGLAFLDHPLLGTGTGSFRQTYAALAAERHTYPTSNPHNEYLMVAVQTGVVGLAVLLLFFYVVWRSAGRLEMWDARQVRTLLLAFAVACLFNSLLLDHKDGHTFGFLLGVFFGGAFRSEDQRRYHDL